MLLVLKTYCVAGVKGLLCFWRVRIVVMLVFKTCCVSGVKDAVLLVLKAYCVPVRPVVMMVCKTCCYVGV